MKVVVSSVPWMIIGGLLWAGLFIKPQPVGGTVQPPVLERRDHYYGIAPAPGGGVWVAGTGGKIVAIDAQAHARVLATPTDQTLQDIAVWDDRHAVAVGNDGVILITADGGPALEGRGGRAPFNGGQQAHPHPGRGGRQSRCHR